MTAPDLATQRDQLRDALLLEQRIRRARVDVVAWAELAGPTERGPFVVQGWQRDFLRRLQGLSESVARGEDRRAQGEAPTQVGKSECVRRWLAWHLATVGSVGLGCYAHDLAVEHSRAIRALLRSPIARRVWPHLTRAKTDEIDEDGEPIRDREDDWSIPAPTPDRRPPRLAARGRRGGLSGRFLPLIVADDLLKDETEYTSTAARDEAWAWLRSQAEARVREHGGTILVLGSRWGVDDPHGRQRANATKGGGDVIEVWSYPLVAKPGDTMGREPGAYLTDGWTPEREAKARAALGRRLARAMLDCDPEADGAGIWKRAAFSRFYSGRPEEVARTCSRTWLSVDGAETAGAGDWSVVSWWGFRNGRYLKLWQDRQQVEYPELRALVAGLIASRKPNATYIEKKSSGKAVYQELARTLPVIGVDVTRSKKDRYNAASPTLEHLCDYPDPSVAPWMADYVDRMVAITGEGDEVDDEADADTLGILADLQAPTAPDYRGMLDGLRGRR